LAKEKPPVFGMIQRTGEVVIRIYARLPQWGYTHRTVCRASGEFAPDQDGDGFCEVHVNTVEGFRSSLRSWLRPHRGRSQERPPLYLGSFEFVHNVRKPGKALWASLVELLVAPWIPG
jgi:transposase